MPENYRLPSNLSPAFSVCNSYENQAVPFLGHFKINWHRTHAFSQSTLLLVGVAFAFFLKIPLLLIGIVGFANMHTIIHFAQEKRKYFPFFDKLEVNWNRLQFFSHSTLVLSAVAFTFFLHLTPIMMGLTAYGVAQTFLYIKEEKNIEMPFLDRMDIKWQNIQFKTNIFLFVSGIAATYLLQMPFILLGLVGFGLTHRILYETNKESLSKKVQLHWDKIALAENSATLLGGFTTAAYLGFPVIMVGLSIYGTTQMIFFHIAHKKPIDYTRQERRVQLLNDKEAEVHATNHELQVQNDQLTKNLVKLKEKQANLQEEIERLGKNRIALLKKDKDIISMEKDKLKLQNEIQELKHKIELLKFKKDFKDQAIQSIQGQELELTRKLRKLERMHANIPKELKQLEEEREKLRIFERDLQVVSKTKLNSCILMLQNVNHFSTATLDMMLKKVEEFSKFLIEMKKEARAVQLSITSNGNELYKKQHEAMLKEIKDGKEQIEAFRQFLAKETEKHRKWQITIEKVLEDEEKIIEKTPDLSEDLDNQEKRHSVQLAQDTLNELNLMIQENKSRGDSLTSGATRKQIETTFENCENALHMLSDSLTRKRGSKILNALKDGRSDDTIEEKSLPAFRHTDSLKLKKIEKLLQEDKEKTAAFYG